MKLHLKHLHFTIPIVAYDPPEHAQGEAIIVRVPTTDPKSIGIVPGMEGDLEDEDGTRRHIRIGKKWRALRHGQELRMSVSSAVVVQPAVQ